MMLNKSRHLLRFTAAFLLPTALLMACEEHGQTCPAVVKEAVIVTVEPVDELSAIAYAFEEEDLLPCEVFGLPEGNRQRFYCGYNRTGSLLVQATMADGEVRERTFTITGNHCGPRQAIEIGVDELPVVQEGSGE